MIMKCKMCGGDLNLNESTTVAECEYCGSIQTVPKLDDEKKATLFARANRLRFSCEFDKASGVYESIISEFSEEAEAYWGLVLCKYGIEYVDDPATAKKIPTCHRSSFSSLMEDNDFEMVMEYADEVSRRVYREEAKAIEELRKSIIEVSSKEEPYDIFICYKETAADGDRTTDSVIAQEVYEALTDKGYRVFFSRITLEDKLGQEYEPYIFAALNSAKIMLAFGTDYEYYNAVWVKNEWSRFIQLMTKDKSKHLIPCYKGIDAYDMPKEFAKLQAQDMGKVGATQDLLRGIDKLLGGKQDASVSQNVSNPTVNSYLDRIFMFLEDGKWRDADEYCEKVLDIEPKNAMAYTGKLLVSLKIGKIESLNEHKEDFSGNENYNKILTFADDELRNRIETQNKTAIYLGAKQILDSATTADECRKARKIYESISDFSNSNEKIAECDEKCIVCQYNYAKQEHSGIQNEEDCLRVKDLFLNIANYSDSASYIESCDEKWRKYVYDNAMQEYSNIQNEEDCVRVKSLFSKIAEYFDSAKHMESCDAKEAEYIKNAEILSKKLPYLNEVAQGLICCRYDFMLGVKSDGTVLHTKKPKEYYFRFEKFDFKKLKDVIAVDIKSDLLWIEKDGCAYKYDSVEQCRLKNIRKISNGVSFDYTWHYDKWLFGEPEPMLSRKLKDFCNEKVAYVLLKPDGTVCVEPKRYSKEYSDGEVYEDFKGSSFDLSETESQKLKSWRNIVSVSTYYRNIYGLRSDGKVETLRDNIKISQWDGIVQLFPAKDFGCSYYSSNLVCGLKKDGRIVVDYDEDLKYDTETTNTIKELTSYRDVIAVCDGLILKSDGTIHGPLAELYDCKSWKLFDGLKDIEKLYETKTSGDISRMEKVLTKLKLKKINLVALWIDGLKQEQCILQTDLTKLKKEYEEWQKIK